MKPMIVRLLLLCLPLVATGCWDLSSLSDGQPVCGAGGACPEGFTCAEDNHCYHPDKLPDLSAALPDLSARACAVGEHDCGDTCVSNLDKNSCGVSCSPCAPITNATTSCDGTSCQYACNTGYRACNGGCVSATDSSNCNGACNPGFHLCGAMCLHDNDVNNCGKRCTPCVPAAGSSGMALCVAAPDGGVVDDAGVEDYICVTPNCAQDSDCDAASYCDQNGVCQTRKTQGSGCNTAGDCKVGGCRVCAAATGGCIDGFCCNTACAGACDACSVAAGGATDGTCSAIAAGSTGTPSCSPYVCNGALATCPGTCTGDVDCVAADYCDNTSHCAARKAQGAACNTASDCAVGGCRECGAGTGGCVDGFCCNIACGGACDACSIAAGASVNGTCAVVSAGSTGAPSCTPYLCNGTLASCPATCASDTDCIAGDFCDNTNHCAGRKAQGAACDTTVDCAVTGCRECAAATAGCVDGFCCNAACGAACDACSAALKGSGANGVCGAIAAGSAGAPSCTPYLCNGASASCPGTCASDAGCIANDFCDNTGHCSGRKAQGAACNTSTDCAVTGCRECLATTAGCVDGFCCDAACGSACDACSAALKGSGANGVCGAVASGSVGAPSCTPYFCNGSSSSCPSTCSTDAECIAGDFCDNTGHCAPRKGPAAACNTSVDCAVAGCRECDASSPGGCVDGFCCNAVCGGVCAACSAAKKGSGPNGVCGPIGNGSDPDGECAAAAMSSCGLDGQCNGGGACELWPSGTVCNPARCVGGTQFAADTCNGSGTCNPGASVPCGKYVCGAVICKSTCANDTECTDANDYCDQTGHCVARKAKGGTCDLVADCKSTGCRECDGTTAVACVDGVCCESACGGACDACAADGTCAPVGAGAPGNPSCAPNLCGAAAACASSCADDNGCAPTGYCAADNTCQAQKTTGGACGDADCAVAPCRECNLGCVSAMCL